MTLRPSRATFFKLISSILIIFFGMSFSFYIWQVYLRIIPNGNSEGFAMIFSKSFIDLVMILTQIYAQYLVWKLNKKLLAFLVTVSPLLIIGAVALLSLIKFAVMANGGMIL